MFLSVHKEYGWASGLSFMLYVSGKVPKPVNSDEYFVEISSLINSTTVSRLSALIGGKPRRFLFRSLIMNTDWLMVVSLCDKFTQSSPGLSKTFDLDHTVFLWVSSALLLPGAS